MKLPSADLRVRLPVSLLTRLDAHAQSRGIPVRDYLIILLDKELPETRELPHVFTRLGRDDDGIIRDVGANGVALD